MDRLQALLQRFTALEHRAGVDPPGTAHSRAVFYREGGTTRLVVIEDDEGQPLVRLTPERDDSGFLTGADIATFPEGTT
jgi:hypothetical protein